MGLNYQFVFPRNDNILLNSEGLKYLLMKSVSFIEGWEKHMPMESSRVLRGHDLFANKLSAKECLKPREKTKRHKRKNSTLNKLHDKERYNQLKSQGYGISTY